MLRIILLLILSTYNLSNSVANSLDYKIKQAIEQSDPYINIGIIISDLTNDQILYKFNENRFYNVASCLKIVTSACANEFFAQDFKIQNKLLSFNNDIYLDIDDDPDFNNRNLNKLFKQWQSTNLTSIKGNFYIINKHFKLTSINPYKIYDDNQYCYGAPITRIHINKNCYHLHVSPGQVNSPVKVTSKHKNLFKIINNAITIKDHSAKMRLFRTINNGSIEISGNMYESSEAFNINLVINDNILYLKSFIEFYLKKYNINLQGKILLTDHIPANSKMIANFTRPIHYIYQDILKKSDNYLADYLFQRITDNHSHDEWFEAGNIIKDYVYERFAVALDKAAIYDGSGLSRLNSVTPQQLNNLLIAIAKKPYFDNFKSYLANNDDVESTLTNSFKDFNGHIYAKTGSMRGTRALAGYIEKNNKLYSFVIVVNNAAFAKSVYTKLERAILDAI